MSATRAQTAGLDPPLTAVEVHARQQATGIATRARVAQRLVDDGVRQAEISRTTGIPTPNVSQRLRRR